MAKDFNFERNTLIKSGHLQSNVIVLKFIDATDADMKRIRQLIGSHFIVGFYDDDEQQWVVCARPLCGFTLYDSEIAYGELLYEYMADIFAFSCMLPTSSSKKGTMFDEYVAQECQKGGLSC